MGMSTTNYENVTVATRIEEKSKSHSSMAKAVLAGSVGNALEWFDYGIYGYFASIISSEFFASKDPITALMLSFVVFGVGFVMRPIGGLIFGHYADKVGRRAALHWDMGTYFSDTLQIITRYFYWWRMGKLHVLFGRICDTL